MAMEYTPWFIVPMKETWVYERFFIKALMVKDKDVIVKDKKNTASEIPIKICFPHYLK